MKPYKAMYACLLILLIILNLSANLQEVLGQPITAPFQDWEAIVSNQQGLNDAHRAYLDSYVWPLSITAAELPTIYVRSTAPFRLRVYRLGWYGGRGAELRYDSQALLPARNGNRKCGSQSTDALLKGEEQNYGLVECVWTRPVRPNIAHLNSGLYLIIVTAKIDSIERNNAAVFVVRDDTSVNRLVIVNPTDAQAYTDWSDTPDALYDAGFAPRSLYGKERVGPTGTIAWPRSSKVSFNRPMSTLDFFKTDYPLIRFLEREGISYSVATDYDLHANRSLLDKRRSVVISGHGEYWSYETEDNVKRFLMRGGNLVAAAANTGYWQVRYEPSIAGLPAPVIVGYKDSALDTGSICSDVVVPQGARCADPFYIDGDPTNDYLLTTRFRNAPVSRPEQLFLGVQYQVEPASNGFELPVTLFTDEIAAMTSLGSGVTQSGNQDIGKYSAETGEWVGNFGWEGDVIHPHVLLRMSPHACLRPIGVSGWKTVRDSNGSGHNVWDTSPSTDHQMHLVLYRPNQSSGYVFAGLTMLWSWGLDDWATMHNFGGPLVSRVDHRLQTITRNMLQAAEVMNFGNDCSKPINLSYYFAKTGAGQSGMSLILKEGDLPGRWSAISITQQNQQAFLTPNPYATPALADWAVVSEAYNLFVADVNADGRADLIAKEKNAPGNWYVALNTGANFVPQPSPWLSGWAVVSEAYNLFVTDVNADGRADLIAKEKNDPGNWDLASSNGRSFIPQSEHFFEP